MHTLPLPAPWDPAQDSMQPHLISLPPPWLTAGLWHQPPLLLPFCGKPQAVSFRTLGRASHADSGTAPPLPWPVWLNLEKGDDGPCHPLPWYKEHRFSGSSRGGSLWSPQGTASADLTSVFLPLSCLWLNIQPPPLSSFLRVTVLSPRPYRFCFLSTFAPAEPKVERSGGLGQAPGPQGAPLLSLRH